MLPKKLHFNII